MAGNSSAPNPERKLVADVKDFFGKSLISEKDLKNPNKEQILLFYTVILSEFGIEVAQVMQPQMKQVDYLGGEIDIFSELIPVLNMVEAIKSLQIPGFHDFSVMHLLNPMPRPTFKYIRLMMNYVFFADQHLVSLRKVFERVADAKIKRKYLLEQRNELKDNINQRATQLKAEESRLANIDSLIEKKMAVLNEFDEEKEKSQEQYERVKAEHTKISEIRDKQYNETQMLNPFIFRLVVNEQTQLAQELSTIEDTVKSLESHASNLTSELSKKEENLNGLKLKWSLEESALKEALNENLCKNKSLTRKFNELSAQKVALDSELESLDKKIKENERRFKAITDKCIEKYEADRQRNKEWKKGLYEKLESGNEVVDKMKSSKKKPTDKSR
ncbi:hypothetical protein LSTR_LSTR007789 [Laodelphax striatellus]|uniref:Kinetochore protein Nuf2 N-terminal domain-containing protein n=1 Tax=Laodelphax striatellus TaxID=195883 RepID=A0A482WMI8_LAOST|nr:hypothetical protein LSTR_LSTR007789 [Laodelphax striatellus]